MLIKRQNVPLFFLIGIVVSLVFHLSQPAYSAQQNETVTTTSERTGAWVDTIQISTTPSEWMAWQEIEAGELDFYTRSLFNKSLYNAVKSSSNTASHLSFSTNLELTFNPTGPVFSGTGKLNPFAVPEIRESMNWLVDRAWIVNNVYAGLAASKYFPIGVARPEYVRYQEAIQTLEANYAYDHQLATATITDEMTALGATQVNGTWHYDGEPVTLIFLIREEDERMAIGDYVADQLESVGFVVDRQYVDAAQASPIWITGDPNDGLWHIYTGGWINTTIERDEGSNFQFYYTPSGLSLPLWQAYSPTPEFLDAADRLADRNFDSMTERADLFTDALTLSMEDSVRLWLSDTKDFAIRHVDTTAAYDLVGSFAGSDLWPYTIRVLGQEGGLVRMAHMAQLNDPWNPLAGTTWVYDQVTMRATQDRAIVRDTQDGLMWPQRIESAEVHAETGLPIERTHDWLTVYLAPTIEVPDDAWVDWDAANEVWITAAEKYAEPQTAKIKSIVHYPSDLFDIVKWHDGSPLSVADFVMAMIVRFDVANPDSPIYDESQVDAHNAFMEEFKGFRITSTSPLVIEFYTDAWELDAEHNVHALWPEYQNGQQYRNGAPWHTMGVGYLAESNNDLAFSRSKATALQVPWMDFIGEPSLSILTNYLNQAQADSFLPYANTLSDYVTTSEIVDRWNSLQSWVNAHDHFWIGTGPFYLDSVSHADEYADELITLQRFPDFPDPADKWDGYSHDPTPQSVHVNHTTGGPGSFFNITAVNFPVYQMASIHVNGTLLGTAFTGASGSFTKTLQTSVNSNEGFYIVTVSVNPAASAMFELDSDAPIRSQEGDFVTFAVPEEIVAYTSFLYLPAIRH